MSADINRRNGSVRWHGIDDEQLCKEAGIQASMGSVGDCCDNAMSESLNECELLAKHRFRTQREASLAFFNFIEAW